MKKYFSVIIIVLLSVSVKQGPVTTVMSANDLSSFAVSNASLSRNAESEKWIIVLHDPRSERSRQWTGGAGYRSPHSYDKSRTLERLTNQLRDEYDLTLLEQWPINSLKVHCLVISISSNNTQTIAQLKQDDRVKWVQPYQIFKGLDKAYLSDNINETVSKPSNTLQQNIGRTGGEDPYRKFQSIFEKIKIDRLKPLLDGKGVSIAMIDSGVEISHSDLVEADTHYKNFINQDRQNLSVTEVARQPAERHGTGIASVIVAQSDNGVGIAGIAPAATLYAYRGCWELSDGKTRCDTLSLSRALDSIVELAPDILNLSLTGPKDYLLEELLTRVIANGTSVIVAFDENRSADDRFPRQRSGVIFARKHDQKTIPNTDYVSIPGTNILTAQPINTYAYMSGNSLSSAHLAAVVALIKQAKDNLKPETLSLLLTRGTAPDLQNKMLNVCEILEKLAVENNCYH